MKKIKLITVLTLTIVSLVACGSNDSSKSSEGGNKTTPKTSEAKKEKSSKMSDSILETKTDKIVIKDVEQITSSDIFGSKPLLALTIEYTNNGERAQSPWIATATSMKAIQETEATVELLSGANGMFPEDYKTDLVKMGDTDVKVGATVEAVIGFEIISPGTPVHLLDFNSTDKAETFERIVETTP